MTDQAQRLDLLLPSWADPDRFNRTQHPIVEEILQRFDEGAELCLLDSACGNGKSLVAYMVAQARAEWLYYLVGTKTLQDQMEDSFPNMSLVKGRGNYTPLNFLDQNISVRKSGTRSGWDGPTCADCDREEMDCTFCDDVDLCPYSLVKNFASSSPFACTNYAYALGEWQSARSKFRNRPLVVLDEADTLVNELLSHVSVSISPKLQQTLRLWAPEKKTVESSWSQWFDEALPHIKLQRDKLHGDSLPVQRQRRTINNLIDKLEFIAKDLTGWVYDYPHGAIEFKPVLVNNLAPSYLWRHGQKFLAMSGSLGSPEQFINNLGYEGSWDVVFAPSLFDKARRPIYYIPCAEMSHKKEKTEWPKMARAVRATIDQYPDKKILVHSQSKLLTRHIYDALTGHERPIFAYFNSNERADIIAEFEQTPGSVLLAMSLNRGYDNRNIDVNVICKTPYPFLGDKRVQKRLYETKDGKMWWANETAIVLVQAYGRSMRAEDDEGITIILDSIFGKFYDQWRQRSNDGNGTKRRHRLFPEFFCEAIDVDSDVRYEIKERMRGGVSGR